MRSRNCLRRSQWCSFPGGRSNRKRASTSGSNHRDSSRVQDHPWPLPTSRCLRCYSRTGCSWSSSCEMDIENLLHKLMERSGKWSYKLKQSFLSTFSETPSPINEVQKTTDDFANKLIGNKKLQDDSILSVVKPRLHW